MKIFVEVHKTAWDCSKVLEKEMHVWKYLTYIPWYISILLGVLFKKR